MVDEGLDVACIAGSAKVCAPGPDQSVITRALLGDYLGHFQIKDVGGVRDLTPVLPGLGAVLLTLCGALLRSWDGWVSL
jgi:hypothetical protein